MIHLCLAGRNVQLAAMLAALHAGRTSANLIKLSANRGTGKTVRLNEIERRVSSARLAVLTHQANPHGDLVESLVDRLPGAATRAWSRTGRFLRDLDNELTVTPNLRVECADAKLTAPRTARAIYADRLRCRCFGLGRS